ncbi:MAG: hypothetical protein FJ306_04075 [Planctomycetes bacterium]|nr:hypothetical protein [Planctomycetota bacterium]
MSPSPLPPAAAANARSLDLLPSLLRGAAVVGVLALATWASGLLPADGSPFVALGAGAALAATGFALVLHGRILDRRFAARMANDAQLIAGRLQGLLAIGLLVKLFALTAGVLWLRAGGVKFAATATFAVAFAAASLVCQVTAAGSLVRTMSRRPVGPSEVGRPGVTGDKAGPAAGEPT